MSRTITALFDTRQDAEDGKARLKLANCDVSHVHIHDQSSLESADDDRGMWSSTRNAPIPHDDRYAYEEGVRRGAFLLTADVDEDQVDGAIRALEDTNSVDLDRRQDEWRTSGWSAAGAAAAGTHGTRRGTDIAGDEERIPIAEEQLIVGKREVERGGARVRSYVREIPVHEQVRLREEHVDVERRPVNQPLRGDAIRDGDVFKEREIEMTERSEEAVVAKEAVVTEELVIRKTAEERTETIDDTVRRTEVEIDDDTGRDRGAVKGSDRI